MSTLQEIETAIRNLPPGDRQQLVADLPGLLPELDGDAAWERIIQDSRPRAALSALLDEAQTGYRQNPLGFPETTDSAFDRHS